MATNAIVFGWNRSIPGREPLSAEHFQEFTQFLGGLMEKGTIESFDAVILTPHGGDLNGFFFIRGENDKLDTLVASKEWTTHVVRAALHLENSGAVRGVTGELVMERMNLWKQHIPR